MFRLALAMVLGCALSCSGNEGADDAAEKQEDVMQPTPGGGGQALEASFKIVPEFDGCEVSSSLETDDLSSLGIRKEDLSSFFGQSSPSGTTDSGQPEVVSLSITWLERKTMIVEAQRAPTEDDFAATCPTEVGALATQISVSSSATGTLTADGFLFTVKPNLLAGSFSATSTTGSNYVLSVKATADGKTSGVVSVVKAANGQRESKSVLMW
jgi:hypothetical protein